jgi:glycosyltransferase involved in cell wall biosynthesis
LQICHVYRQFYPLTVGGIETQISLISNFLAEYDSNLHFSLITDRTVFLPFLHRNLPKVEFCDNLKVFRLGPNIAKIANDFFDVIQMRAGVQNQDRHYARKLQEIVAHRLFNEAKRIKAVSEMDVFHLHGMFGSDLEYELLPFLLSRLFEKPLIVHLRGTYYPGPEAMPIPDELRMKILDYATAVVTHNTNVLCKLKEWNLQRKSYLIPNAINLERFPMRKSCHIDKRDHPTIALVGRLSHFRDPVTCIFAFRLLLKKIPDAKLHIVGDGALDSVIQHLVGKLGLGESVVMYGPRRDVNNFLQKSDVFWATSAINNYPSNSLLEALAVGLPVVATDVGLTREWIENEQNGILISPKNPRELADATESILTNEALCEHLSINARATAEKYDVKTIYPRIAQLYYSLSSKSSNVNL